MQCFIIKIYPYYFSMIYNTWPHIQLYSYKICIMYTVHPHPVLLFNKKKTDRISSQFMQVKVGGISTTKLFVHVENNKVEAFFWVKKMQRKRYKSVYFVVVVAERLLTSISNSSNVQNAKLCFTKGFRLKTLIRIHIIMGLFTSIGTQNTQCYVSYLGVILAALIQE